MVWILITVRGAGKSADVIRGKNMKKRKRKRGKCYRKRREDKRYFKK
jgi:hypothetical protein